MPVYLREIESLKSKLQGIKGNEEDDKPDRDKKSKEARVKKAASDFEYFCRYYLREAFPLPFAQYQKVLIDIINTGSAKASHIKKLKNYIHPDDREFLKPVKKLGGIADIEPREHGKTTRFAQALPLWRILTKTNQYPITISSSGTAAATIMDAIKYELEENERIISDFGYQVGNIWQSRKITLVNGNAMSSLGRGESIRGIKFRYRRPTLVIVDDLLKDKEVESRAIRDYTMKWFKRAVMNLAKDCMILLTNTIMHPEDPPSTILKELREKGKFKNWIGIKLKATTPEGKPLWPSKWSLKDLAQKKIDLGSYIYATEFENEPVSEEDRKFQKNWFVQKDLTDIDLDSLVRKVMGVDPATGTDTGAFSAIVISGRTKAGDIWVLDSFIERVSDIAFLQKVISYHRIWDVDLINFEEEVFQAIYKNDLMRLAADEGLVLPVKGFTQTKNKLFRISSMSPGVESGLIKFRAGQKRLLEQLYDFPKGFVDGPDAMEMSISGLIKGTGSPGVAPSGTKRHSQSVLRGF